MNVVFYLLPRRNHFYIYFNIMDKILSQNIKNCHSFCSRLDATTFVLRQFNLLFSGCYILQWFIKLQSVVMTLLCCRHCCGVFAQGRCRHTFHHDNRDIEHRDYLFYFLDFLSRNVLNKQNLFLTTMQ